MITDHDEYVPTIINKQTSLNKPRVSRAIVSPEVPKLNHVAMNKKRD